MYTDICFYTFDYNADRSITITEELFLEYDWDRIQEIRKELSGDGYEKSIQGNDSTVEGKAIRPFVGTEYSNTLDNGRESGRNAPIHGQESEGGRVRTDGRGEQDSEKISETAEKNRVKADSNESAFSNGEDGSRSSISSTDALDIDFERRINAVRGTYSSLAETLRAREDETRRTKREFLPDIETTNAVAAELGALGLADGATMTDLRKAVYDAAVAIRGFDTLAEAGKYGK